MTEYFYVLHAVEKKIKIPALLKTPDLLSINPNGEKIGYLGRRSHARWDYLFRSFHTLKQEEINSLFSSKQIKELIKIESKFILGETPIKKSPISSAMNPSDSPTKSETINYNDLIKFINAQIKLEKKLFKDKSDTHIYEKIKFFANKKYN